MESIRFHISPPRYYAADLILACTTSVDDMPACYMVTAEALEECFGTRSWRQEDLLQTVGSHRDIIEGMARSLFELTNSHNIALRSGHFRFGIQLS